MLPNQVEELMGNLVECIVLVENGWSICNQEETKADLLLGEALEVWKWMLSKSFVAVSRQARKSKI